MNRNEHTAALAGVPLDIAIGTEALVATTYRPALVITVAGKEAWASIRGGSDGCGSGRDCVASLSEGDDGGQKLRLLHIGGPFLQTDFISIKEYS